ncbi:MAG: LLM class flavin-dependent oxidoreductase, partial [Actinomycetota bacterium]
MDFSFWIGNGHAWPDILRTAQHVEQGGWHGVWFADHFMPNAEEIDEPIHEVWSVLSGLAVATERVRLGPLVCGQARQDRPDLVDGLVDLLGVGHEVVGEPDPV